MFPIALNAGVTTLSSSEFNNSTKRGITPASITACILSLVPSVKYERAQEASAGIKQIV